MNAFKDLRDWALFQRKEKYVMVMYNDLLFQIYSPKLPNDEVVFNIRRNIPGEEPDVTFVEHFPTENFPGKFWVYLNKEENQKVYEQDRLRMHEEFQMSESLEKFKQVFRQVFHDTRFDYIVDNLLSSSTSN